MYSEGDFLPGLVVDRYGALLSVQILTAGMELLRREIVSMFAETLAPRRRRLPWTDADSP